MPFISQLKEMDENLAVNTIQIDLYYDKKAGHAAVGKNETIGYINKIKPNKNMEGIKS